MFHELPDGVQVFEYLSRLSGSRCASPICSGTSGRWDCPELQPPVTVRPK